ncbi:unnamed protein product [Aphis gossypii]|uniref:Uncharacterized protein n=1 Tax=Aphis gossypii TaxID=80765 RepID=A0A9P0NGR2_APHGO|nr:unnamed protein product [Aphis gossypii]
MCIIIICVDCVSATVPSIVLKNTTHERFQTLCTCIIMIMIIIIIIIMKIIINVAIRNTHRSSGRFKSPLASHRRHQHHHYNLTAITLHGNHRCRAVFIMNFCKQNVMEFRSKTLRPRRRKKSLINGVLD